MVALALLLVVVALLALLVRQAPDFTLGVWATSHAWMVRIYAGVGSVGDFAGGAIVLAAFAAAMWAVVRYRKPLRQALRELWERLGG